MTAKFNSVELWKGQCIGIGSYGKVCKAKCGDLICAAKLLLESLFDPAVPHDQLDSAGVKTVRRFEQECEFMRSIRHPNIVQYLGLYDDPTTGVHALLMELMDQNLTSFLKKSYGPLPYYFQVNLCHDISRALSYLHSNQIIHRDLSSNNILLIGNIRAKVSDFGMARLGDLYSSVSRISLTKGVGTEPYMPPECNLRRPVYTEKVDCFSFGVNVIQILTRLPPDPAERHEEVETDDPSFPSGFALRVIVEIDRRKKHIDAIDSKHPLLNLALGCLKDKSTERPTASELCERLCELKELQEYTDSKESTCDRDRVNCHENNEYRNAHRCSTCDVGINTEKDEQIVELEEQFESQKERLTRQDEELRNSKESIEEKEERLKEMADLIREKDETIGELKRTNDSQLEKIKQLRQQLEQVRCIVGEKDQLVADSERRLTGTQQQLNTSIAEKKVLHQALKHRDVTNIRLTSRKDSKKAPCTMYRSNDAVVSESAVYLRPAETQDIFKYSQVSGWSKFAQCPFRSSPLTIINDLLTAVGGCSDYGYVDQLFSLTGSGNKKKWTEEFPPMPTKRSHAAILCTGSDLVVAGGKRERREVLTTVEVLNIESRRWSVAGDLPEPCWYSSMFILDGRLYVVGGVNTSDNQTNIVYACSLESLCQSLRSVSSQSSNHSTGTSQFSGRNESSPTRQNGGATLTASTPNEPSSAHTVDWKRICNLPVTQSTCVLFQDRLLAISGKISNADVPTRDIYVYSPVMDSWDVVGHVIIGRFACFAAVLPDNQLMIVGGYTDSKTAHDSVEFASSV